MSHYRLLFMKGSDGPVVGTEEFLARDDVEAVHEAERRSGREQTELWCDKRIVKRFASAPEDEIVW